MQVLKIENLSKEYGPVRALNNLNMTVEQGQIMGILGPNGSGKTTTLAIILGILKQSGGHFTWFQDKYEKHRLQIGSILETPNFYPYLNAEENLDIVRQIKGSDDKDFSELLKLVKLYGRRKSPFKTFSLGMKQRLAIAATLINDPEVVIFDEPTNGLDPEGIAEVRNTLQKIAARGKTVIMASHILDEVEKICSHVTIIKKGQLMSSGSIGSILSNDITLELSSENQELLLGFLRSRQDIKTITPKAKFIECTADESLNAAELNFAAFKSNINLTHLVSRKTRLEEEFLTITGNQSKKSTNA